MTEEREQYALVPRQELSPAIWEMFLQIDQATYQSRRFGATQGETAIKLIFCLENGLPLSAANTGLYVVNGRLGVMGNVIAAKLRQHPEYDYVIAKLTNEGCTIAILRNAEILGEASFNKEDAERITDPKGKRLIDKDNWRNYPQEMYFNRAISRAYKLFAPDIFSQPIYIPEELDGTGPILEGEYTPLHTEYGVTLESLLEKFTAEEIMAANNGKIPATSEEVRAVAQKLGEG